MSDDTYNGWVNRETWALFLWITNDEGLYNAYRGLVNLWARRHDVPAIADALRTITELYFGPAFDGTWALPPERQAMASDIGSLWRIDYREIAEHLTDPDDEANIQSAPCGCRFWDRDAASTAQPTLPCAEARGLGLTEYLEHVAEAKRALILHGR